MKLRFTKMQGAGNDFVVLDATEQPLSLSREQLRHLGDRRFGVGADQILVVEPTDTPNTDFRYRIFNGASGAEVEHCGNGARCFARFVQQRGLVQGSTVRVETQNNRLVLQLQSDGRVTVDMNVPHFEPGTLPFQAEGLAFQPRGGYGLWPLELPDGTAVAGAVVSMGNPHLVLLVEDAELAPVAQWGPALESHFRFPRRVNVGFLQVVDPHTVKLRVYERDAGETLACGTGACAAVVAGIRLGVLSERVDVHTHGGLLTVEWALQREGLGAHVWMTGPAETVFEGEIEL